MLKFFATPLLALLVFQGPLASKVTPSRSDTICVRKVDGGVLQSESFQVNGTEVRYRGYVYSDSSYGYFESDVVEGRITKKSVFYEYLKDSTLMVVAEYYGKKYNGNFRSYYRNGQPEVVYHYNMDKLDGVQYEYYDNGQMSLETNYVRDRQTGHFRLWYSNGNLKEEGVTVNGNYNDTIRFYHENGQLYTILIYNDGMPWEVIATYDQYGRSLDKGTLKNGTGTLRNYDLHGWLEDYDVYEKGKYIETWVEEFDLEDY